MQASVQCRFYSIARAQASAVPIVENLRTGKAEGDRHPKVRHGVLIGAGAKILGNVEVGRGAKVGAGSVVLEDVPPHCTVAGVPAQIVGTPNVDEPALEMDHRLPCNPDE